MTLKLPSFESLENDRMGFFEQKSEKKSIFPSIGTIFFNLSTPTETNKPTFKIPDINWGTFEKAAETLYGHVDQTSKIVNTPIKDIKSAITPLIKDAATSKPPKPKDPKEEEKKAKEINRKRIFFESLRFFRASKSAMLRVGGRMISRLEVTAKLKVSSSYEGLTNDRGEVYTYVETIIEQENSKMEAEQLKKSKEMKLSQATGGKAGIMREGELLMGGENKQHFTNVAG